MADLSFGLGSRFPWYKCSTNITDVKIIINSDDDRADDLLALKQKKELTSIYISITFCNL